MTFSPQNKTKTKDMLQKAAENKSAYRRQEICSIVMLKAQGQAADVLISLRIASLSLDSPPGDEAL